jgi:transcriptional regulator with XRE-family HTH domain
MKITEQCRRVLYHTDLLSEPRRQRRHLRADLSTTGTKITPKQRQAEYREEQQREEEVRIRRQMTDDPVQCMDLVLKWRNSSYEKLGEIIGCSDRTIRRMVRGETPPNKKMAVKICFILNLPPSVSGKLLNTLSTASLSAYYGSEDQWLDEALHVKYLEPLPAVERYLAPYHVEL